MLQPTDQWQSIAIYLRRSMGLSDGTIEQQDQAFQALVRILMFHGTRGITKAMEAKEID